MTNAQKHVGPRLAAWLAAAFVVAAALGGTSGPARAANILRSGETPQVLAPPVASNSASTTVTINGLLGGTVTAGRFSLIIPPAAIPGVVSITLTQPDPTVMQCEIHISPESSNHFRLPVLMVARAGGLLGLPLLQHSEIQWLNPATGEWVGVPGSILNLAGLSLQAPLWHFSSYRVGSKAGW